MLQISTQNSSTFTILVALESITPINFLWPKESSITFYENKLNNMKT